MTLSTSTSRCQVAAGVLVVSANGHLRRSLRARLGTSRWLLEEAGSGAEALQLLEATDFDLLLFDPVLPDLEAGEFRSLLRSQFPAIDVVTIDPHTGQPVEGSVVPDPLMSHLSDTTGTKEFLPAAAALPAHAVPVPNPSGLPGMVGSSATMQRVYAMIRLVAGRSTTVLIQGETGTGKDLIARAIHDLSPRSAKAFVVVNCAAIPEPLLEAELFGYVKGAFTGAVQSRIGRIHAAQGGTLFLDEIGELPLGLQSKLLRFLEQGEVQRLGSADNFCIDVRVLAATNANVRKLSEEKRFRDDLYYRLAVFPVHLPPLRDRPGDLPDLAATFVAGFSEGRVQLTPEALQILEQHPWPGNVRELRNVIERATILVGGGRKILPEHIVI